MKTDTIFYQLLQTFPGLIFELLGESTQKAENYQFSSREIKELARRFDGIFLPTTAAPELMIYFVEVQFQDKSDFYWRFLTEIVIYLNQYKPVQDWMAVALFASRDIDNNFPYQLRGFEITGLVDGSMGIVGKTSIYFGRDAAGDDLQDLQTKTDR